MIVADSGAIVAPLDRDETHHEAMLELYRDDPSDWLLPWAILPEVDYLVSKYIGPEAELALSPTSRADRSVPTGARLRTSSEPRRSTVSTATWRSDSSTRS